MRRELLCQALVREYRVKALPVALRAVLLAVVAFLQQPSGKRPWSGVVLRQARQFRSGSSVHTA